MQTIGIVGGIGPESTIEYYRLILQSYRERQPDGSSPPIVINSIDLQKVLALVAANELVDLTRYLLDSVEELARAGSDFAVIASNTPHIVFEEIRRQSPVPLISIVESTRERATKLGLTRVGLIGTRFTMQRGFYSNVFSVQGIEVVAPDIDDQAYIHDVYVNEFVKGNIRTETRDTLLNIVRRLQSVEQIQALILGGTELSLILSDGMVGDLPFLDTTRIHVNAIVDRLFS